MAGFRRPRHLGPEEALHSPGEWLGFQVAGLAAQGLRPVRRCRHLLHVSIPTTANVVDNEHRSPQHL